MDFFKMLRLFGIGQQMFKSERFSAAKTTARRKSGNAAKKMVSVGYFRIKAYL